jgi:hypothetical protein
MRNVFFIFILISLNLGAQPTGQDWYRLRQETIERINQKLVKDPKNDVLRWKRVNLIFYDYHVSFDSKDYCIEDTITNIVLPKWLSGSDRFRKKILSYQGIYIINELNILIENKADFILGSIDASDYHIDWELDKNPREIIYTAPSCLYFKRGQYYDAKGIDSSAVEDYLKALSYNPPIKLKEEICYSLAANYYHRYKLKSNNNIKDTTYLELSLKYIDLITPSISEEEVNKYLRDKYEAEKILLLKTLNKSERLIDYLKRLTINWLKFDISNNSASYESRKYLTMLMEYVFDLPASDKLKKQFLQDIIKSLENR